MPYLRSKSDIHTLPHLKKRRTKLRSKLTPAEARMWSILKCSKLDGRKFRRQHSVGSYILDFYCPSEKLAIELDGAKHFTAGGFEYDVKRNRYLREQGVRVLRFENNIVFDDEEWVLAVIRSEFGWQERTTPSAELKDNSASTPPS